jgi:hypothetical protein
MRQVRAMSKTVDNLQRVASALEDGRRPWRSFLGHVRTDDLQSAPPDRYGAPL